MSESTKRKEFLNRLPEFYKKDDEAALYGHGGYGCGYYGGISINYKLACLLVKEQVSIDSEVTEVKEAHQIDTVGGISLDRLAKIFDLSRGDWTDDEFRLFIRSAVTGLIGGGTAPNLKAALSLVTGISEANIKITDSGAANIVVEIPKKYYDAKPELTVVVAKYKPVGVSFSLIAGDPGKWDTGKWGDCVWT